MQQTLHWKGFISCGGMGLKGTSHGGLGEFEEES